MLQQTRVEAVKGYYSRFLEALPDVEALANAEEEQLMKLWEGLGYYSRARNLQKCARILMEHHQGQLPADYHLLQSLYSGCYCLHCFWASCACRGRQCFAGLQQMPGRLQGYYFTGNEKMGYNKADRSFRSTAARDFRGF